MKQFQYLELTYPYKISINGYPYECLRIGFLTENKHWRYSIYISDTNKKRIVLIENSAKFTSVKSRDEYF